MFRTSTPMKFPTLSNPTWMSLVRSHRWSVQLLPNLQISRRNRAEGVAASNIRRIMPSVASVYGHPVFTGGNLQVLFHGDTFRCFLTDTTVDSLVGLFLYFCRCVDEICYLQNKSKSKSKKVRYSALATKFAHNERAKMKGT